MTDIVYSYLNCTTKYQKIVNWQRKIDLIISLVQVSIQICWKCFGCQPLCNNSKTITYLTISYHHKESKLPARHFGLHKWSQTTLKHCQLNIWWKLQYNHLLCYVEFRGCQRCNFVLQSTLNCLNLEWQLVEHVG